MAERVQRQYPLPRQQGNPDTNYKELVAAAGLDPSKDWVVVEARSVIDTGSSTPFFVQIDRNGFLSQRTKLGEEASTSNIPWELGKGHLFRLIGRPMPNASYEGEWPAWTVRADKAPWPEKALLLQIWLMQAWRPEGVIVAQVIWSPNEPRGDRSIRVLDDSWKDDDLTSAGKALRFLEGITANKQVGRTRNQDDPAWRAQMRRIEAYLEKRGKSLGSAVRHFCLADLGEFNTEDFDAEIEGEDVESKRHRAALAKLKRWRKDWKKLSESLKEA